MRYKKKCNNCRKEYICYYPDSSYCSHECRYKIEGIPKEKECKNCKKKFKPYFREQVNCCSDCYFKSEDLKEFARNSHLIKNNGSWKGNLGNIKEDAGYTAIHEWINRNKEFTFNCEICDKKVESRGQLDLANVSGDYNRDVNDFIWLCRSCHTKFDKLKKRYIVIGVESKLGKYLDAEEKRKARWLLDNGKFNRILIAYKKERGVIEYENFG